MTAIIALEDQPMTVCNRLKLQAEQFLYYLPNLFPTFGNCSIILF